MRRVDGKRGGRFALAPEGEFEAERRYLKRTNVLGGRPSTGVELVETRCFSEGKGRYTSYAGSEELDAAVLRAARMGFADPAGERMAGTIAAIRDELSAGGPLLYRYTGQRVLACSFWLAEALARAGRLDDARATMEELLPLANDLGLYSEEIDPESHELLGDFPHGLTHLSLVTAAAAVASADRD